MTPSSATPRISASTKPSKRHVLITGSSGYVGQHLIASLLLGDSSFDGRDVSGAGAKKIGEGVGVDEDHVQYELFCAYNSLSTFKDDMDALIRRQQQHFPTHTPRANIHLIPNVDFSQHNYIDVIQQAIGGVHGDNANESLPLDAIIHLAALSSPGYCEQNAALTYKVNCPIDLLKFNAPIIYLSTDQVYEGNKHYYVEDIDETVPVNVYGRSKLAFERVLLRRSDADGHVRALLNDREIGANDTCRRLLQGITIDSTTPSAHSNSVILRSSLILGPPPPLENGCKKGAYPSFLQFIEGRLQNSSPTEYFVNEFRSVVHIQDVITAIRHFLENGTATTQNNDVRIYNLGGSARVSRYDIALEVARHLNIDSSSAKAVDRPVGVGGGGGVPSPPDISMNVEKITRELNVLKMKGLTEIVASTFV